MLFTDSRRSTRYIALLPVTLNIADQENNHVAGPFSARIIDLSRHGASLFLTRVMAGQYHVCFSVQEHSHHLIKVRFLPTEHDVAAGMEQPEQHPETSVDLEHEADMDDVEAVLSKLEVSARPVWFDSYDYKDLVAFKMGVEFSDPIPRGNMSMIRKAMKKQLAKF